jgi:hypothetical protein
MSPIDAGVTPGLLKRTLNHLVDMNRSLGHFSTGRIVAINLAALISPRHSTWHPRNAMRRSTSEHTERYPNHNPSNLNISVSLKVMLQYEDYQLQAISNDPTPPQEKKIKSLVSTQETLCPGTVYHHLLAKLLQPPFNAILNPHLSQPFATHFAAHSAPTQPYLPTILINRSGAPKA